MATDSQIWPRDALPNDTVLHGYQIKQVLGRGGFGITYRAVDKIEQDFAIKEYFPRQFSSRVGETVSPTDQSDTQSFADCLDRFTDEARALTELSRRATAGDGVVKVMTFFEINGTAYIVMEFLDGQSLESLIQQNKAGIPQETLLGIMLPLLKALGSVHEAGMLHRDIKPANILLRENGRPALIDFGAARKSSTQATHFTTIYTEKYAPIEQILGTRQGPFSDIYAVGATLYQAIGGSDALAQGGVDSRARYQAILRHEPDPLVPAVTLGAGRYDPVILRAIDQAMRITAEDRPQSVADLLALLNDPAAADETRIVRPVPDDTVLVGTGPAASVQDQATQFHPGVEATHFAGTRSTVPIDPSIGATQFVPRNGTSTARGTGALTGVIAAVAVLAIALAGGIYWYRLPTPVATTLPDKKPAPDESAGPDVALPTDHPTTDADQAYARKDYAEALRLYQPAADQGQASAQYRVGYIYQHGLGGVRPDATQALSWYSKAANQGVAPAQYQVGYMFQHGLATTKDPVQALEWYRKAAEQDYPVAEYQIGFLYLNGVGVKSDRSQAMLWYGKAAAHGVVEAEYGLGRLYADGNGIPPDMGQARSWISKAAAEGSREAQDWLRVHPG